MKGLDQTLPYDAPCYNFARGKADECTGVIPAGQPHSCWIGASLDIVKGEPDHPLNTPRTCVHCVRAMNWKVYENAKLLVKVELTFSDGSKRVLEGEDALIWDEAAASTSVNAWVHGQEFPKLSWKNIP